MSRLRSVLEEAALWLYIIPVVLGMCVLYWIGRLCGVRLEDDF